MGDADIVQHSRREVGQSLNVSSGAKVITKRADGIRDDAEDNLADSAADGSDGLGLHLAGATRSDVVVERAQAINLGEVSWCSDDREDRCMGIVIVSRNPIRDHLVGVE